MTRAPISINIHDSHFGIWQHNAQDSTFNQEVFQPILKSFQKRGWRVTADPQVYKHHRRISKSYRIAAKGQLRTEIKICGRCIELEFWSEAETLDRILFDGQPIYLIWSRKNGAYYRTNYSGYSSSKSGAGKYTRAEAEAEVRRVPHILEAHGDNGEIIKFGEAA